MSNPVPVHATPLAQPPERSSSLSGYSPMREDAAAAPAHGQPVHGPSGGEIHAENPADYLTKWVNKSKFKASDIYMSNWR